MCRLRAFDGDLTRGHSSVPLSHMVLMGPRSARRGRWDLPFGSAIQSPWGLMWRRCARRTVRGEED